MIPLFVPSCVTTSLRQHPSALLISWFPGIKSENADLVLFVRVGGFYELFGADADLGALVGLKLMGGAKPSSAASPVTPGASDWSVMHRAGCRAQSFMFWASKVVALGYSVGRVEEVGSLNAPSASKAGKGSVSSIASKAKTKERALVQVYSPATFGLWWEGFDDGAEHACSSTTAVYLAVCEDVKTSGLLGACCVDLAGGVLAVGVWQEVDVERSTLAGLVEASGVREVVVDDLGRLSVDTRRALGGLRVSADSGLEMRCNLRYVRKHGAGSGPRPDSVVTAAGGLIGQEAARLVAEAEAGGRELFGGSLSSSAHRAVGVQAIAVALQYMRDTNVMHGMATRMHVRGLDMGEDVAAASALHSSPSTFSPPTCMVLNGTSLRNMEIFHGASLHRFLSGFTCTPMGARTIRRWLAQPLMNVEDIEHRLDVVDAFRSGGLVDCRMLEEGLLKLHDVEKRMPMVAQQLSTHQALGDANQSLMSLAAPPTRPLAADQERMVTWGHVKRFSSVIQEILYFSKEYISWFSGAMPEATAENPLLHSIHEDAVAAQDVCLPILGSIPLPGTGAGANAGSAPADGEPVLLPHGVWPSIDRCRAVVEAREAELAAHGQTLIDMVVEACRIAGSNGTRTTAATLRKIRISGTDEAIGLTCNRSLESAMAHAFPHWEPSERSRSGIVYREARLTALAVDLAEAQRAYNLAANQAMSVLFNLFLDEYGTLLRFCQSIGQVDALLAFAKLAADGHGLDHVVLSRPRFEMTTAVTKPRLFLRDAWNPQLLTHTSPASIVPNTISVGGGSPNAVIVSGANSGGKTSILKTAAIATIMAQIGCYVPCSYSRITPVSKILTRLGARDRLAAGESTFAIEMKETSAILGQADGQSLAIIDELGRGTSPRDGMAIAWATLNTLASRCRTILATHYHELNEDFEFDPRVARFHMPIDRDEGRFRLRAGPEPQFESGGILCARDAGVCEPVLRRAGRVSEKIKRLMREARASRERRLAMALLEMMPGPATTGVDRPSPMSHALPSLNSLEKIEQVQLRVEFLLDDD